MNNGKWEKSTSQISLLFGADENTVVEVTEMRKVALEKKRTIIYVSGAEKEVKGELLKGKPY